MLYRRRLVTRLAYWLSALGYNLRDRSASNRMYLAYFVFFWLVWVVAVFALLGQTLAEWLVRLPIEPAPWSVNLVLIGLAAWALLELWNAARRSPFVFTEEDAFLICQTPVNRRRVGLALYFSYFAGALLPFAAGAVVLAFALAEIQVGHERAGFLIQYVVNSLRALSIVLALQAALLAAAWGVGALRLRGKQQPWLRPAVLGLVALLAAAWAADQRLPGLWQAVCSPLFFPLQAAFGVGGINWAAGLALSLLLLAGGLAFLAVVSPAINLSQAAQETSRGAAVQQARRYSNFDLAETILLRQRLGGAHAPSGLLRWPGAWALLQKDLLQSWRAFVPGQVLPWLWLFALSVGMFWPLGWLVQLVLAGIWAVTLGGLASHRLRSDLARWWVLRSLPLSAAGLLWAELCQPVCLAVVLGWGALRLIGVPLAGGLFAAALLPFLAASAALAGAYDILRRSQGRALMSPSIAEENVPQVNIWGAVQGVASVLAPLGLMAWANMAGGLVAGLAWAALPLAVSIAWLNLRSATSAYRLIG